MQVRGSKRASSTVPEFIAVDTETTGLFVNHGAKPFLTSLCNEEGETKAWEWAVNPITRQPKIPRSHKEQIRKELEGKILVFHNAKFDLRMFAAIDIYFDFYEDDFTTYPTKLSTKQKKSKPPIVICCPTFHDTLLASHACSTEDKHGLKELGVKYLGYSDSDERSLKEAVNAAARYCKSHKIDIDLGKDPNGDRKTAYDYWLPRFVDPDNDCCLRYALRDVERTILLWGVFSDAMAELDVEEGYQRERKLLKTVYRMETDGISIRTDSLDKKTKELERNIRKQEKTIGKFLSQEGYPEVNLNSNKELPDLLFNQMEYPVVKETKGGNPSTDKDAIEALIEICEEDEDQEVIDGFFVPYLIRSSNQSAIRYLRSYNAFKIGTDRAYADLYPSLNQTGTGTTRFSSSKPNGQNACLHPDTEVLTSEGWVRAEDIADSHKVAQYWKDSKKIDFVEPSKIHKHRFVGDLVNVKTELHINFTVTPNHRCLVENRKTGELKEVLAENFPNDFKLPQAGYYSEGGTNLSQQQIIFLCATQADGSYVKQGGIRYAFKKQRKIKRLRTCLQEIKAKFTEKEVGDITTFYISADCPSAKLAKVWMPHKQFNQKFLELNKASLETLCEELFFWDGDYTRKSVYSSSDKNNVEWAQIFFLLAGKRAETVTRTPKNAWTKKPHYYVNVTAQDYSLTSNRTLSKVKHEGYVYCVTVPSSFIIIRSNGKVAITGNSKITEVDIGKQVTIPGSRNRDIFAPRPGKVWYAIDYNQLELRIFAAVSGEDSLIQALAEGYDFHGYVASRIFDKPPEEITKQERRIAKNTNFAIIFGASPRKVNATAGIPDAYELFAGLFPNVHSYMQSTIKEVRKTGYVRTLDGYRLDVPHNAPYKAVNYKVQGTAGSIVKQAMIDIDEEGLVDWINARMALQIHDELLIEVDEDSEYNHPSNIYDICRAMENAGAKLGVDTPVSCDIITTDWGHGEEVTVTKTQLKPIKKAA